MNVKKKKHDKQTSRRWTKREEIHVGNLCSRLMTLALRKGHLNGINPYTADGSYNTSMVFPFLKLKWPSSGHKNTHHFRKNIVQNIAYKITNPPNENKDIRSNNTKHVNYQFRLSQPFYRSISMVIPEKCISFHQIFNGIVWIKLAIYYCTCVPLLVRTPMTPFPTLCGESEVCVKEVILVASDCTVGLR